MSLEFRGDGPDTSRKQATLIFSGDKWNIGRWDPFQDSGITPKASKAATPRPEIRRLALGQLFYGRDAHQGKFRPPLKRVWNLTIARINRVLLPWATPLP